MERCLEEDEKIRVDSLIKEMNNAILAIQTEVLRGTGYTGYLKEKMNIVNTNINCINDILAK